MEKIEALAKHLGIEPDEITEDGNTFSIGGEEYLVLTDEEAEDLWEESIEQYFEECIEPEFDKAMESLGNAGSYYKFDMEMFKRDCKTDGRGHSLSSYDGEENEEGDYYIYRTN